MAIRVSGYQLGLFVSCALAACKQSAPPPPPPPVVHQPPAKPAEEPGRWYHARLVFDGVGDLPFFLHIPPVGRNGTAHVLNGDEKAEFKAEWRDNEITITGPWTYTSEIEALLQPKTGALEGTWTRDTPLWGAVVRKFAATPIDTPDPRNRFSGPADAAAVNVSGTWRFQFATHEEGKGSLEQTPDGVVRGYIKPGQLGDIRFLAGNVRGNKLSLSTFNGNSANLVLAEVAGDAASMTGTMSMQNVWNEKFTATRVDEYQFVNKVRLKDGKKTVSLPGLDKYRGKPTLAVIFATWCSSCNDAFPYFEQLYEKYHPQGLEAVGVAYDLSDDEKTNLVQLDAFRAKHKVPWELRQVPCTPETWASVMPPELEGWDGLPIVMLVRPDGTVQTVFGGWFGPATGAEGDRLRVWLEDLTRQLVSTAKG